jgi:hypothetical protein
MPPGYPGGEILDLASSVLAATSATTASATTGVAHRPIFEIAMRTRP